MPSQRTAGPRASAWSTVTAPTVIMTSPTELAETSAHACLSPACDGSTSPTSSRYASWTGNPANGVAPRHPESRTSAPMGECGDGMSPILCWLMIRPMREIALRDTTGRQTDRSASRGRPRRGAESACVLAMLALCLCCSMGCREQREPEIDAAVTTTANGLDAVNALRSAVRARDEGRFSRSVDRCAAELGTRGSSRLPLNCVAQPVRLCAQNAHRGRPARSAWRQETRRSSLQRRGGCTPRPLPRAFYTLLRATNRA